MFIEYTLVVSSPCYFKYYEKMLKTCCHFPNSCLPKVLIQLKLITSDGQVLVSRQDCR